MNDAPNIAPAPADSSVEPGSVKSVARFWVCFIVCLGILSIISGLMLVGLFLVMGYRII